MSNVIFLIGTEGSGKTYRAKLLTKNVHPKALYVFDVNNEWSKEYPYPFDPEIETFLTKIENTRKSVSVVEDATSFFSVHGRDDKLIKIITARRHTENSFILLFHSFQDVPKYIFRKATDIFIFKTLDSPKYMEREYSDTIFYEPWKRVMQKCNGHKFFSTYPPPKGVIPPFEYLNRRMLATV
jgi:hypothetical protein